MASEMTQLGMLLRRPDPLLAFRWIVRDVPRGQAYGVTPNYVESFEIPFSNVKATGVFMGGGYNYFPEFHDTSAFNVVFYGDGNGNALKYIWNWKQQVKDFSTSLYNLPEDFKEDWVVVMLDSKGDEVIELTYSGCWPADTGQLSLTSEGSERITFNQNFSVDSMKIKFLK